MRTLLYAFLILNVIACSDSNQDLTTREPITYPLPEHYNPNSDPTAVALAKEVFEACGGYDNWLDTRFIAWTFFGSRRLLWDKHENLARIKSLRDDYQAIVHTIDTTGLVYYRGEELTDQDSIKKYLDRAYRIWINDSYWLVLPFKLLDPGVHLAYVGKDTSEQGILSDVIELTFDEVGVTPNNKYRIWIGEDSKLINQWSFYRNAENPEPLFVNPWDDYFKRGDIFLSSSRGPNRTLDDIEVYDEFDSRAFTTLDPIDF